MENIKIGNSLELSDELLNILKSNGRSKNIEDVNVLQIFYNLYKSTPNLYSISTNDDYYEYEKLNKELNKLFPDNKILYEEIYHDLNKNKTFNRKTVYSLCDGVVCVINCELPEELYIINHDVKNVKLVCTNNYFLVRDKFDKFSDTINVFKECKLKEIDNVNIGMVSYEDGNFYVKEFDIKDKTFKIDEMDLHYGQGFTDFNNQLIQRLKEDSKGLVLFHGIAGSGKTFYIRHLLRKIKEINNNNNVLYFPPTMVGSLTDPSFINFISDWVSDSKGKNYLFIEDAEPLLESRDLTRNIGVTNLLNLTDGLLNDILNIQVIATFNTNLKNIDDALLRPERLTARKEFKKLKGERLKSMFEYLKINDQDGKLLKKELSLAEIYSLKKNSKTITHDIEDDTKKIGFSN